MGLEVPVRVTDACDLCGECTSICQFNAIKKLGGRIMPFSDMCHGCGGCTAVCAPHAIVTGGRELGRIGFGALEDGRIFLEGRSRVGEAMTPPLIRALLRKASACARRAVDLLREEAELDQLPRVGDDAELFERLRALRKEISTELEMAPYMVFSDKALRGLCRLRPPTRAELNQVNGIGEIKADA